MVQLRPLKTGALNDLGPFVHPNARLQQDRRMLKRERNPCSLQAPLPAMWDDERGNRPEMERDDERTGDAS